MDAQLAVSRVRPRLGTENHFTGKRVKQKLSICFDNHGGLVKVNRVTVLPLSGETVFSQEAHSADTAVRPSSEVLAQRTLSTIAIQAHP